MKNFSSVVAHIGVVVTSRLPAQWCSLLEASSTETSLGVVLIPWEHDCGA